VVTGLLNYKWRRFGRYVYYINLTLFVSFLIFLNTYMLLFPAFYQIDWEKLVNLRKYINSNRSASGKCQYQTIKPKAY